MLGQSLYGHTGIFITLRWGIALAYLLFHVPLTRQIATFQVIKDVYIAYRNVDAMHVTLKKAVYNCLFKYPIFVTTEDFQKSNEIT